MKVTIIYGSETGTAEGLAEITETRLKAAGLETEVVNMGDIRADGLVNYPRLLIITSTWGDGEPPSNAWDLWGQLSTKPNLDLSSVHYSVCALGDTSYPQFCKCGQDFDTFLEELGAKRIFPRKDCDLDYEASFEEWLTGVQGALSAIPA